MVQSSQTGHLSWSHLLTQTTRNTLLASRNRLHFKLKRRADGSMFANVPFFLESPLDKDAVKHLARVSKEATLQTERSRRWFDVGKRAIYPGATSWQRRRETLSSRIERGYTSN